MAYVGADHEFHDADYVREWARRFEISPERQRLFADICEQILPFVNKANATIVELGAGPGFLAEYILNYFSHIQYIGVDFSQAMLDIAKERIERHLSRVQFVRLDLLQDSLEQLPVTPVQAVVSTWSLHDLGGSEAIRRVYDESQSILDGILVNGDFIDPEIEGVSYEPGRISVEQHLEMLSELGYQKVRCHALYDHDLDTPTPANNYACLIAENIN